jgi:cation diffusion facilitator CzcD-associated flavoprotein CzcO
MTSVRVAIVGTGFSGLGAAIKLKEAGIEDFVVLERADDLGGTWRDNHYPGCCCDVPSHLYSYSFELNALWTRAFAPQWEIWDYLRRTAEKHGVLPHIRYEHELTNAAWDDEAQRWRIDTTGGGFSAQVLVLGAGALSNPMIPYLPGLETFEGKAFHSANWDHDHDFTGERVAAIGTGASAIQFVPQVQPRVRRLHLFQRTPPWIIPRWDHEIGRWEKRLLTLIPKLPAIVRALIYAGLEVRVLGFRHPPLMKTVEWVARWHLKRQVPDPALRAKLTPDYTIGCKRILISDNYYPSLTEPNVEVVTEGIKEVRPRSVVTADGVEREVDTILWGTGFYVTEFPIAACVRGREGVLLAEKWREGAEAHLGVNVAGFPNMVLMTGPNSGLGHTSMVYMIESQLKLPGRCAASARSARRRGVRRARERAGRVQRLRAGRDGGHGLDGRPLQELVPRRQRQEPLAVADVDVRVPAPYEALPARGVRAHRTRSERLITVRFPARSRASTATR